MVLEALSKVPGVLGDLSIPMRFINSAAGTLHDTGALLLAIVTGPTAASTIYNDRSAGTRMSLQGR